MSHQIHSYSELQQQIHEDLRIQHPEWVRPNGDCPTCDSYERRLAELIGRFQSSRTQLGRCLIRPINRTKQKTSQT